MSTAAVVTAYCLVGVLVALGIEVHARATQWRVDEDDHAKAAASGIFWPLVGAAWLIWRGVRGIGRLAQAIADRIPAWVEKAKELREEMR